MIIRILKQLVTKEEVEQYLWQAWNALNEQIKDLHPCYKQLVTQAFIRQLHAPEWYLGCYTTHPNCTDAHMAGIKIADTHMIALTENGNLPILHCSIESKGVIECYTIQDLPIYVKPGGTCFIKEYELSRARLQSITDNGPAPESAVNSKQDLMNLIENGNLPTQQTFLFESEGGNINDDDQIGVD